MGNLRGAAWRLAIFLTVCLLGAFALLAIFAQIRFGQGTTFVAEFTNVSGLKKGDIVVSNINAVNRAICVLPGDAEDLLISSEFTILRPKNKTDVDAYYLWAVLRSAAVVAEWLRVTIEVNAAGHPPQPAVAIGSWRS